MFLDESTLQGPAHQHDWYAGPTFIHKGQEDQVADYRCAVGLKPPRCISCKAWYDHCPRCMGRI